jgi:hypothetical protein
MARGGEQEEVLGGGVRPAAGAAVLPLFAGTLLLSAFLVFWVEPMFTRMVLPQLGGSPAVWNTAMVFYQAALLAGYGYAHLIGRWLSRRRQIALHLALFGLAASALPIAIDPSSPPPTEGTPVLWLFGVLAGALGLPFVVLSATAPLLQLWFTTSGHRTAADPYYLYGASNLGSMAALLGYPLLLEPSLDLTEQSRAWTAGYAALALLVAACALASWWRPQASAGPPRAARGARQHGVGWSTRLHWLALAAVPSALLLAVTAHITTDLAAVPLLWVIPLALYLSTFVVTFARRPWPRHDWMVRAQPFVVIPLVLLFSRNLPFWLALPLHLGGFFVSAMMCHGELARRRPATEHLTEFYLWLALGGMLGGMAAALLAPLLFDAVLEYPIALVAACLLRPTGARGRRRGPLELGLPVAVLAMILLQARWRQLGLPELDHELPLLLLVPAAMLLLGMAEEPRRFGLGMAAAFLATLLGAEADQVMTRERSFFGVYTVKRDPAGFHVLVHGTTVHGAQAIQPERRRDPLTYYLRDGPLGQLLFAFEPRTIGAVGLGIGTVACYRQPGQRWTFYEIDPLIERIARDRRFFHYLEDCAPDAPVILGDARRSLQVAPAGHYDLLILDAFSSDAIPLHLITREALALYLAKLAPGGVIALHVSNRNLDLAPVVADLVADAGVVGWLRTHTPPGAAQHGYRSVSSWVAIARRAADLPAIDRDRRWQRLVARPDSRPWTDAFSDLVGALRWKL